MLARILPPNMSTTDRLIRVLVGLILLSLTVLGPNSPWGYIGLVPLITGLVGSCPAYTVIGWSSLRLSRAH